MGRWREALGEALRGAAWAPLSVLGAHAVASLGFDAYRRFPPLDLPMHFLGGAAIAFFFDRLGRAARSRGLLGAPAPIVRAVLLMSLATSAAVFWEFAEFFSDRFLGTRAQLGLEDTLLDMFLGFAGGAGYAFLAAFSGGRVEAGGATVRVGRGVRQEGSNGDLRVRSLVAMAFVADVPRSIAFYERLGFRVRNTFTQAGTSVLSWAWLDSDRASLMVARASEPVDPERQAVLFYLYVDDVAAAREELTAGGVAAGPIAFPFYAPRGELRIADPDGYVLMVTHT
jgi:hypothetical protein